MFEYRLISCTKCSHQDFTTENSCYNYTIANSFNQINGYRSGTKEEVMDHIRHTLQALNSKIKDLNGATVKPVYRAAEQNSF